jgi:endonuclease/exonuclease/phosphatase family metal-dependent hydrolase
MNKILKLSLYLAFILFSLLLFLNKLAIIFPNVYQIQFLNLGFPFYLFGFIFSSIFLLYYNYSFKKLLYCIFIFFLIKNSIYYTFSFHFLSNSNKGNFNLIHTNPDYKSLFTKNDTLAILLNKIKINQSNIICIQEANTKDRKILNDSLLKLNDIKYYYNNTKRSSILSASKSEIFNYKNIIFPKSTNALMQFDFEFNHKKYRYISFHLQSLHIHKSRIQDLNEDLIDEFSEKENIRFFIRKYANAYYKRISQVDSLSKWINNSPYPVIVSGDMNDVPYGYCYAKLRANTNIKDAFSEEGFGISSTYKSFFPWFRIDYVFVDKKIEVIQYEKIPKTISDHFPITVEMKLP